jgi:hypothetical protein
MISRSEGTEIFVQIFQAQRRGGKFSSRRTQDRRTAQSQKHKKSGLFLIAFFLDDVMWFICSERMHFKDKFTFLNLKQPNISLKYWQYLDGNDTRKIRIIPLSERNFFENALSVVYIPARFRGSLCSRSSGSTG